MKQTVKRTLQLITHILGPPISEDDLKSCRRILDQTVAPALGQGRVPLRSSGSLSMRIASKCRYQAENFRHVFGDAPKHGQLETNQKNLAVDSDAVARALQRCGKSTDHMIAKAAATSYESIEDRERTAAVVRLHEKAGS